MAYALSYDVPANPQMYEQVKAGVGDEPIKGLVAHLVLQTDSGLRHIGVYESEEDWQRFFADRARPAVHATLKAAGFEQMPPDPTFEELRLVDLQLPS